MPGSKSRRVPARMLALAAGIVAGVACTSKAPRELASDARNPPIVSVADWPLHGRTADEGRYSPLDRIDTHNVGRLGLAWWLDLDSNRGQEATPIIVDGVMYATSSWSRVYAV